MRRARVDLNQTAVVAALRTVGATVQHLHAVGQGCPDLLVGFRGRSLCFEVKDGPKAKLTPAQDEWHAAWRGHVEVVTRVEDALEKLFAATDGVTVIEHRGAVR